MGALEKMSVERSTEAIMAAARERRYLSYADIAAANGLKWSLDISRNINKHLDDVLKHADADGAPLITAIVVNKPNIKTGRLDPAALSGFVKCANGLGHHVSDLNAEAFLLEQQEETFAFANSRREGVAG